jgi:RNA polymerase sigma-70 factor (ECF subfamily)
MADRDPLENPEPLIRRVFAYVAYRIGDGADAEDVTSATFERALRYRDTFDRRRGQPISWLLGIAGNCLSEYYANRPMTVSEVPEIAAAGELASDAAVRLDLRRAVSLLSERDAELIALRYGADLTAKQIAEVTGMRTNAVEVALHRSLATLRRVLETGEAPAGTGRRQRVAE